MGCVGFRVLGPVEIWRDGRPSAGLPPQHRAILAALLVDAGQAVPLDVLVDRVWAGEPAGPRLTSLHAAISKLRRRLEPDVTGGGWRLLVTRAPGYRLQVTTGEVDALRFAELLGQSRELAQRGEDAAARAAVGEALALWRGPAYADIAAGFAREEAERLEQLRLAALELAAELDLRLGRDAEVVEPLRDLVRAEPLREGLRAALMLALYRSGRQAEALQVYADARAVLADELGVDPGPELQTLHRRILRQDADLQQPEPAAPPPAPARTPAPTRTGALPAALTSFVGRDAELRMLADALAGGRLVTLVGPGGAGKTRLALEAAHRQEAAGLPAAFVELIGVEEPGLVPAQVAAALGVGLTGGDPADALAGALGGRPLLVVLDNCEHLLDAAAQLAAGLLPRCPDLRMLVTSREPLGVPGEDVLPCGPLSVAGPDSDAVRLFLDRARLVARRFARPSPGDADLAATLCAELDGLPLALELAAACLATLPLAEIVARVEDRFALLSDGRRAAAPHQRTLAATVQWSVDLLGAEERAVLAAVSVFSAGFAPDAVEAVAGPEVGGPALAALRALAAKSLIEVDHERGRYRMLETLRQYADRTLDEGSRRQLRDRHLAFLVDLAERIEPTLRRPGGATGWRRLDAERQNLRAALGHALATGQGGSALRLAAAVSWWWYRRGDVQEGRGWLARALEAAPDAPVPVVLRALLGDGLLAYLGGDVAGVLARTDEMIRLASGQDDGLLAIALVLRAFLQAVLGRADEVDRAGLERARELAQGDLGDMSWLRAEITMTLGQLARAEGDLEGALEHLARAEAIAADLGHMWAWASIKWVAAKVLVDLGRATEALASLSAMLAQEEMDGDAPAVLAGLLTAIGAATGAGEPRAAAVLAGTVDVQARRVGYDPLRMDPLDGPRYLAAARASIDPAAHDAAVAEGRGLDLGAACGLVHALAGGQARNVASTSPTGMLTSSSSTTAR